MKKFLKKSDKGFSLVELIVVICIMAVLIGVIAPAFMKYVGKSKTSAKQTNLDELRKAANTVLADPDLGSISKGKVVIKNQKITTNTVGQKFADLLTASIGGEGKYPKNETYTIEVTGDSEKGYSATVINGETSATDSNGETSATDSNGETSATDSSTNN